MIPRRLFLAGSMWSGAALVLPGALALWSIPKLLSQLGPSRFALLGIAWVLIGHAGLLDLGLGRALTQAVSRALAENELDEAAAITRRGIVFTLVLGIVSSVGLCLFAPAVARALRDSGHVPAAELRACLVVLAVGIPAITVSATLRGALEAAHAYRSASLGRVILGASTYLGPLLVAHHAEPMVLSLVMLVAGRYVVTMMYFVSVAWLGLVRRQYRPGRSLSLDMWAYGGWITLSNLISPLMSSGDRLLVGGLMSLEIAAAYAAPHEVVSRFNILPGAMVVVLFPAFSRAGTATGEGYVELYQRALRLTVSTLAPICIAVVTLRSELIELWIRSATGSETAQILAILAAGALFNGVALVPVALLHGIGRADLAAKFHLCELPIFLVMAIGLAKSFGAQGLAAAWTIRVFVDAALLLRGARAAIPQLLPPFLQLSLAAVGLGIGSFVGGYGSLTVKLVFVIVCGAISAMQVRRVLISWTER